MNENQKQKMQSFVDELSNDNQQAILLPHLASITEGLVHMITQNASNQIGTLTMETLVTVLQVDEQFVDSVESKISPLAIALFLKSTTGNKTKKNVLLFFYKYLNQIYYF